MDIVAFGKDLTRITRRGRAQRGSQHCTLAQNAVVKGQHRVSSGHKERRFNAECKVDGISSEFKKMYYTIVKD